MKMIYLDHNATTPVAPEVIEAMSQTSREFWANASSGHPLGWAVQEELERCRASVARFIGAKAAEIVFTSGGTESDNLALLGIMRAGRDRGKHVVVSAVEHHAVIESCDTLMAEGYDITKLPVDRYGRVDPEDVRKAVRSDTLLVSIMHANNEVGTLQPIREIGQMLREREIAFHTDAAQSLGKIPVDVNHLHVDLLTCSSHKIYGPKGMGFLYVRQGLRPLPLLIGGGQEKGLRSGTENLPGIAGLSKALELAQERMEGEGRRFGALRDALFRDLSKAVGGVHLNGHPQLRLPGTLSFSIEGIQSHRLIEALNRQGICVSASAACTTGSIKPSHVLSAMGFSDIHAAGTLRLSIGRANREEELPRIVETLSSAVKQLRRPKE